MSIIVTSTTGSAADTNAAAEMYGDTLVQPAEDSPARVAEEGGEGNVTPVITSEDGRVATTTGNKEECEEVAADLAEEREERKEQYLDGPHMGKTRAKLLRRLSRMHEQNEDLRTRLAQYESGPQQAQPQNGDGSQEVEPQPQPSLPQNQDQLRWEAARIESEIAYPYKLEAAKARYSDFEQSIKAADDHPLPVWALEGMRMSPNGPDMVYWLSKHTDYADKILELDRAGQVAKAFELLNSISNGLSIGQLHNGASHEPRPRPKSAAPAPISPVGGGVSRDSGDPGKMQYADYKNWYNQKYGGRR